jgi:hypothetical protein
MGGIILMCCAQLDPKRENIIATLEIYGQGASLSRLQAVRSTLQELKNQLSHQKSPDVNTAIEEAIERLETAS